MQVIVAIVAALISGLAATWYQFRRQRARLYAVPMSFTRELCGGEALVTVPGPVAEKLSQSVYLAGYGAPVAQPSLVAEAAQACADLQTLGPPLRQAMAEVVAAIERKDDDALLKAALRSPLRMPFFDKFLMAAANGRALANNKELIRQTQQIKALEQRWEDAGKPPAEIPMFPTVYDGSYQFGLPGGPIVLGRDRKKWPVAEQELPPFFQALRFLDRDLLRESFERLMTLLAADIQTAAEALPELSALLAEHYRCVCRLYLANVGAVPAMIQGGGTIQVRRAGRSAPVRCYMATLGNGGGIGRRENSLLLSAGADIKIALVSNFELCEDLDLRNALRGADETPCEARAELMSVSSARRGNKTVRSRWTPTAFSTPGPGAL